MPSHNEHRSIVELILKLGVTGSILTAGVATAAAVDPQVESSPAASETILFEQISPVFGASKYAQEPIEAPSSVTVITAEEIRRLGHRSLADVLRSVRGFFVSYDRNYSYAGVRGFCRPGDYNTRLLLMVDGHRVNDNIYDSASFGPEFLLDLEVVDRIEIVRGPSSSLYGTNAFFGVVNVITRDGRALKGLEVSAGAGSGRAWNGSVAYGNRLVNGFEVLVGASQYDSRGGSLYFPEFDGQDGGDGWAHGRDGEETEKLFLKAARGDFHLEATYSSREKDIPTASFGTDFDSGTEKSTDDFGFLSVGYDHAFAGGRQVAAQVSYNSSYNEGLYPYDGVANRDVSHGNWWGLETTLVQNIGARQRAIAGVEFRDDCRQDQSNHDVSPYFVYLDSKESSRSWALFGQDEIRIGDRLILNVGARYDHYSSFGGTTNPRLAAIWRTSDTTAVKVLLGRAFRAPNNYERFYGNINQKGNPEASPETIRSAELVLESTRGHLHFVSALYHYRLKNLIGLTVDPADGFLQYRNVDRIRSTGLELALDGRMAPRLDGRLSYSIQESRNELTDQRLDNSPRHLAKTGLSIPFFGDQLAATLEGQYTSSTRATSGAHTGSTTLFNLGLRGRPSRSGFDLGAWIYNVTNEEYFNSGSEEHVQQLIQQDGRSFRLNVRHVY